MDNFIGLFLIAVIVEGLISYANMILSADKTIDWKCVSAIVLGVFIGISYNLDLLGLFGVHSSVPFIGNVLTGILLSRGSNYLADLIKVISNISKGPQLE